MLSDNQLLKAKKLFEISKNSTFYRGKYINYEELKDYEDFFKIPILSKDEIIGREHHLLTKDYNQNNIIEDYTSGTTGKAMTCYHSIKERNYKAYKLWKNRRKNANILPLDKRALFSPYYAFLEGEKIFFDDEDNDLYLSNINMTDEDMKDYFNALVEFKPKWFTSVPSALYLFSNYILREKLNVEEIGLEMIEVNGEMLFDYQKNIIEEVFGKILFNHYGSRETWCLAYSCKYGNLHGYDEDFIYELINIDTEGIGELVVTDLCNNTWPLLRYNLGDKVKLLSHDCGCGNNSIILDVVGGRKQEDFEIDGWIGNSVIFHYSVSRINSEFGHSIKQYQIIQQASNSFLINIVKGHGYQTLHGELLVKEILSKIPIGINIMLNYVKEIENTGNKFIYFKKEVNHNDKR
ncbi:hypothetical protein P9B03_09135 [Metasolibacillus meyeri]|uniref:Phenylacetate-CoA ligase n=1 Tax=Metasolibacillus meyeri TaxID=1071052 RepID=A0AAW9NWD9_9BACL|nr:hypothetical protein [Metasolibacillus meyeri]MEC1178643.1 hypothetical protein [Metasolibacillus meyeri]